MTAPKLYAVMTDSSRPYDKSHLARVRPDARDPHTSFWTTTCVEDVWLLPREEAEEVRDQLHHNSPRIVGEKKALARIALQANQKSQARGIEASKTDAELTPQPVE